MGACIRKRVVYDMSCKGIQFFVNVEALLSSMLISHFLVTSWFDSVCVSVTGWMNFREKHLHEYELQLFDYNI